jgi:hypothetical protein
MTIATLSRSRPAKRPVRRLLRRVLGLVFTMLSLTTPALAELGNNETSVQSDRAHMRAALLRMTRADRYAVHEMQMPFGTLVREYVSATGTVFGVAWEGPWQPDLRLLLGAYFERYTRAVRANRAGRAGHRPLLIEEDGLIVQASGHPRAYTGRAYLPLVVPQGVNADTIR